MPESVAGSSSIASTGRRLRVDRGPGANARRVWHTDTSLGARRQAPSEKRRLEAHSRLTAPGTLRGARDRLASASYSGASVMTLKEKIRGFVEAQGTRSVCDDCVADHLSLTRRQVSAAGPVLQRHGIIRRYSGQCSGCCTNRKLSVPLGR